MHQLKLFLAVSALFICVAGCGSEETKIIEPSNYELTEQESANREKEKEMLADQRQQ